MILKYKEELKIMENTKIRSVGRPKLKYDSITANTEIEKYKNRRAASHWYI